MDSRSYRALRVALLAAEPSVVEQMALDSERRAMMEQDYAGQQQRQMHRSWHREWENLASLAEPLAADAIAQGGNEAEILRRIEDVALDVFEPLLDELLLVEYQGYAHLDLLHKLQEDLRAGRLQDLDHYLQYFQREFLAYYRNERYMAGYGPVHRRWTPNGPVPKRRRA
jgi:hypothetical protein